jgi:hypothetical protein
MVPADRGERHGFDVSTAASGDGATGPASSHVDRHVPAEVDAARVELTRAAEESLGADARGHDHDQGRWGEVCVDLSSHSSNFKKLFPAIPEHR